MAIKKSVKSKLSVISIIVGSALIIGFALFVGARVATVEVDGWGGGTPPLFYIALMVLCVLCASAIVQAFKIYFQNEKVHRTNNLFNTAQPIRRFDTAGYPQSLFDKLKADGFEITKEQVYDTDCPVHLAKRIRRRFMTLIYIVENYPLHKDYGRLEEMINSQIKRIMVTDDHASKGAVVVFHLYQDIRPDAKVLEYAKKYVKIANPAYINAVGELSTGKLWYMSESGASTYEDYDLNLKKISRSEYAIAERIIEQFIKKNGTSGDNQQSDGISQN